MGLGVVDVGACTECRCSRCPDSPLLAYAQIGCIPGPEARLQLEILVPIGPEPKPLKRSAAREMFISGTGIVAELDDNGYASIIVRGRQRFRPLQQTEISVVLRCPSCGACPAIATAHLVEILLHAIGQHQTAVGINPSGLVRPLQRPPSECDCSWHGQASI